MKSGNIQHILAWYMSTLFLIRILVCSGQGLAKVASSSGLQVILEGYEQKNSSIQDF